MQSCPILSLLSQHNDSAANSQHNSTVNHNEQHSAAQQNATLPLNSQNTTALLSTSVPVSVVGQHRTHSTGVHRTDRDSTHPACTSPDSETLVSNACVNSHLYSAHTHTHAHTHTPTHTYTHTAKGGEINDRRLVTRVLLVLTD